MMQAALLAVYGGASHLPAALLSTRSCSLPSCSTITLRGLRGGRFDGMKRCVRALCFGVAASVLLLACELPVPQVPLSQATTEDPDALCGAAVRVFTRKGWKPSNTCNTEARTVETGGVGYRELGWGEDAQGTASFRAIVSSGQFEVGATCSRTDEAKVVTQVDCPAATQQTKQALANDIINESHTMAGARRVRDQPLAGGTPAPAGNGCTKDTDCKETRICSSGACIDPGGVAPSPGPQGSGPSRTRCEITLPPEGCPWHRGPTGTFNDAYDGSDTIRTRCEKRPLEFFYFCNDTGPVVGRFFSGDTVVSEVRSQPTTRCEVVLSSEGCPAHKEVGSTFNDTDEGSRNNEARCMSRASEFHSWCSGSRAVRTRFYNAGTMVRESIAP
jgi:hypothetical protein